MLYRLDRRSFVTLTAGLACATAAPAAHAQSRLKVAALFAGKIDDAGFMEAGYRGLTAARDKLGVDIVWRDQVPAERDRLAGALRDLAKDRPALVIAHGGQNNDAATLAAADFPTATFVVTQGNVSGPESRQLRSAAGGVGIPRRCARRVGDKDRHRRPHVRHPRCPGAERSCSLCAGHRARQPLQFDC